MQNHKYKVPAIALRQSSWRRSTGPRLGLLHDLASKLLWEIGTLQPPDDDIILSGEGFSLDEQIQKIEIDLIRHALTITGGKQTEAAALLGLKVTTLNSKIKRLGIEISDLRRSGRRREPAR